MTKIKIWLDDIRTPPDHTWKWFKDAESLIEYLSYSRGTRLQDVEIISLDHDLGQDDKAKEREFQHLAAMQRGAPESAMLHIQHSQIAQNYGYLTEHVGDLIQRVSKDISFAHGNYEVMDEKINKTDRMLNHPYGFEREMNEQIRSNVQYYQEKGVGPNGKKPYVSEADAREQLRQLGKAYADEHRKLKPLNRVQKLSQDAAVSLGEMRFSDTRQHLGDLKKEIMKGREHWKELANEYEGENKKSGYDVAKLIEELVIVNRRPMPEVVIHSANPVGRKNMQAAIDNARRRSR